MAIKLVEVIEGTRIAMGKTRADLAEDMQEESGEAWDKTKLDKILNGDFCPRADNLFLILKCLKMPCYPWEWCRSKKIGKEED